MSREEAREIVVEAERKRPGRRTLLTFGIPTTAALAAGAVVAVGAIPGSDGTITACFAGPTGAFVNDLRQAPGALRVIDAATPSDPAQAASPQYSCQDNETKITWNQRGPSGPAGPTGSVGAAGAPGGQGAPGARGAAGSGLVGITTFGLSSPHSEIFLKLDGIDGESSDHKHKGEIEIESAGLGANTSTGTGSQGTGQGAGKVSLSSFTITKKLDKASPGLLKAAVSGKHIANAVLYFAKSSKSGALDFLTYKFADVLVSSIHDGASSKGTPSEQVDFKFQKLSETIYDAKGKPTTVTYDLKASKTA